MDQLMMSTPGAQGALIRKVAADIGPTVLRTYKRIIERSGSDAKPYGGEKPEWYDYPNGARLWIGGMDRPGKVLSGERDFIYVNQAEELELADWETLITRATGRGAVTSMPMVFGDCNPGPPNHWIKERERDGALKVFESRHEDNPTLFNDAGEITEQGKRTLMILDSLTGTRFMRLRKGLWVSAEGVVFDNYDPAKHLIDRFDIPKDWRRIRVIDFGYTNAFVCQWWAIDPDDRMYLYREIYMTQRTVKVHSVQIKSLSENERIEATVTDHDAEDRATLEENDIRSEPAVKDVSRGLQSVKDRLKVAGDGKPRIFFLRDSLVERDESLAETRKPMSTEQEISGYIWKKNTDGKASSEEPVKKDDHGMDTMRYAVMYVDSGVRKYGYESFRKRKADEPKADDNTAGERSGAVYDLLRDLDLPTE
jgi:phage terminase large subunit